MTASDLPTAGHVSPDAMARTLATYMASPDAIRRAVLSEFGCSPSVLTIRWYRHQATEARRKVPAEPFKPHEGHDPRAAYERAARASRIFLERIAHERRAMVRA